MNTQPEVRFRAVETYIKNGESLRRTSEKLGLPHMTLWRWVKWYKIGGKKNLKRKRQYRRPWNRPSKEMEESVMMLKERKPGLTLRKAQQTLETEGIKMSIRGIWSIWNRYALTARAKKSGLYPFGPFTPEAKDALLRIKQKIGEGMTREAAKIANQLPSFPNDNIITIIPDKLLSRKRQLDKLSLLFTKMPFREYYKKAKLLREIFEKEKRYYSSIFAGILGMLALSWMERTQERLKLVKKLNEKAKFLREPRVKFLLSIEEGKLKSTSLNYADTMLCLAQCKKLLRSLPSEPVYPDYVASLFTSIGDFKNAIVYCNKMAELSSFEDKYDKKIFSSKIANLYAIAGRYSESRKCLKNAEKERRGFKTLFLLSSGYCAFGQGNLKEADTCLRKALETSRKEQVANYIKSASVNLAATKAALSNTKEANTTLRKYLPLLRKSKTMRDIAEIELLSGRKIDDKQTLRFPVLRLLSLIKDSSTPGRYKRALRYAETKGLTGFFHRAIVFFPEIVVSMLEKGMNTGL
ncbi:helix-turn-helix domain-containing protein, partial [candidate division WOR-3 bacterium]|nr:helix-turn-helix domain-containing protein [candidate division WOR-3 bacterium]